jgi:hypothetical protein
LASKVDAAQLATSKVDNEKGGAALQCSFCAKSQFQIRKLIAGPKVFICDECVSLCGEILEDENEFDVFGAGDDDAWSAYVRERGAAALGGHVTRAKNHVAHWRNSLEQIKRKLASKAGNGGQAEGVADLVALKERHERALRRFEEALRLTAGQPGEATGP